MGEAGSAISPVLLGGGLLVFLVLLLLVMRRRSADSRLLVRVRALAEDGEWAEVVAAVGPFEDRIPPNPCLLELLARAYARSGNVERARRVGRRILRGGMVGTPAEVTARIRRLMTELDAREAYESGVSAFRSERWSAAARAFQKLGGGPAYPAAAIYLTMCLVKMGKADLAQAQLRALNQDDLENGALYQLALAFEEGGLPGEARSLLERLVVRDMNFHDAAARLEAVKAAQARASDPERVAPARDVVDLVRPQIPPRYELREKLGMGGMGIVILARDRERDMDVAVKVLSPILAENEEIRARFQAEAGALMRLEHPNIVRIFDVGGEALPFYVMEYLKGRSLKAWVDEGTLPVRDHLYVALQVAAALGHAHGQNVIHRDVKPDNVIIEEHGLVKLVDFGLAKYLDATALTRTDAVVGTQLYMAPEQITHGTIDRPTDVYAFGVMLYQQLTGVPPFTEQPMWEHVHRIPTDPGRLNPSLGPRIRMLILRCLEKDPANRHRSMATLEADLKEAMREASASDAGSGSVLLGGAGAA